MARFTQSSRKDEFPDRPIRSVRKKNLFINADDVTIPIRFPKGRPTMTEDERGGGRGDVTYLDPRKFRRGQIQRPRARAGRSRIISCALHPLIRDSVAKSCSSCIHHPLRGLPAREGGMVTGMTLCFRAATAGLFKLINMKTLISPDVLIPASICARARARDSWISHPLKLSSHALLSTGRDDRASFRRHRPPWRGESWV